MTASATPYRWGVLGTGRMASEFVHELRLTERAQPVAVASKTPERARAFAEAEGMPRFFTGCDALIRSGEVDVVYIASTNETHFETALRCIENRLPVLVEKPICTSTADLETLMQAAAEHRVFCMEAMWTVFFPAIRALQKSLTPIGPIRELDASFCIDVPYAPTHRLYDPQKGGGALFDIGIYLLTFARALFGSEILRMERQLSSAPTGVDDAGNITLHYAEGRAAKLIYSVREAHPHTAVITGTNGRAEVQDFFHPSRVTLFPTGAAPVETPYIYPLKGYHYEIEAVQQALDAGVVACDEMPLEISLETLTLMERILHDK